MKKVITVLVLGLAIVSANAQNMRVRTPNDNLKSTEIVGPNTMAFRIYAPKAETVTIGGDFSGALTKSENGVWEIVVSGIEPGFYRYSFNVDGVTTLDPKSAQAIETYSLAYYDPTGDEFFSLKNVAHGAMSERYYYSNTTQSVRRLHVWTPAGFEKMTAKLPVFYLVHGGGDVDSGWHKLGAAGLILDNLLAEGKMNPMIVVMPDGHMDADLFVNELCDDIVPFIESTYNVYSDPAHRALSGLSNGGIETMNVILNRHQMFDYYAILSSGWFVGTPAFDANVEKLGGIVNDFNKHVKFLLFTQGGPEDIAYKNGQATMAAWKEKGFKFDYTEGPGGHTFFTWRYNLRDVAPLLFK